MTFKNIFPHGIRLKAAQLVSHSGMNVRMMSTNAHSFGSSITHPSFHFSQA